jgi:dihydrofolate reductase
VRKLIYSMMMSLDGFIETPDRKLDWVVIDEELHRFANEEARETGAFLYGRGLYENMAAYWPTAEADPSIPDYMVEFAQIWKDTPKIVFSTTLDKVDWNSRLVRDNAAEEVAKLKQQPGEDLSVGGPNLASTFVRLGLVDEYRILVHPVVIGGGTPFFPDLEKPIMLKLLETRTFGSGVVYLRYQLTTGDSGA